ncbi:hypothetical protein SK128_020165 [Halocaridina rubra]|uniref:Uncharacterized protein n=1 Tax=Halocaridina rubra TaxID=373956 RepID=A0AAN9AA28_HALRR
MVCIKWEEQRVNEETENEIGSESLVSQLQQPGGIKRSSSTDGPEAKRARVSVGGSSRGSIDISKPMDKNQADAVVYFLLRLACQVNESTTSPGMIAPGEALSRRCVLLLKRALKLDMWPNADPKLVWLDKLFLNLESAQPNLSNVCVGLEVLTYLIGTLRNEQILGAMRGLTRGLVACMTCTNIRVVRLTHALLTRLMSTFPTEPTSSSVASRFEELEELYARIAKIIVEGLTSYEKNANAVPALLFSTLMILKAACQNNPCYIDRQIMPFMKVLQKMVRDHLSHTTSDNSSAASSPEPTFFCYGLSPFFVILFVNAHPYTLQTSLNNMILLKLIYSYLPPLPVYSGAIHAVLQSLRLCGVSGKGESLPSLKHTLNSFAFITFDSHSSSQPSTLVTLQPCKYERRYKCH